MTALHCQGGQQRPVVGLDVRALGGQRTSHRVRGTGRYVQELKRYFSTNSGTLPFELSFLEEADFALPGLVKNAVRYLPAGKRTFESQVLAPLFAKRERMRALSLLHFPIHLDAPAWSPRRRVVTVLDLIPLIFDDLYRKPQLSLRFRFARWLEFQAARSADRIITISENSARDIEHLLRIPRERIRVTPLGVSNAFFKDFSPDECFRIRAKYRLPHEARLVLYVGGIDQRKNISGLFEIFRQVCERSLEGRRPLPLLVISGELSSESEYPALKSLLEGFAYREHVRLVGYVEDSDLAVLYHSAAVFLFPSLYEGFGLPPLEALAAGCPVVSSNASCMPEVLGSAATLFDPGHGHEFAASEVYRLLDSCFHVHDRREAGRRHAKLFSWEKTGEATVAAYQEALILPSQHTSFEEETQACVHS